MQEYKFLPTDEFVRPIGRTVMLSDCRIMSLSGSGVEFTYFGKKCSVTFLGDSSATRSEEEPQLWKDQSRIAIFVDGKLYIDRCISHAKEILNVCEDFPDDEPKQHVIKIIKLSEPRMSMVGLGELTIDAEGPAQPTPQAEKYIEFVGDSITCGYGVDTFSENEPFSTATENASKAYAYLTAALLGADYSLVSYSGHGLISGYTADPTTPKLTELVQPYYEILSYSYHNFRGLNVQDIPWDFESERKADMVVINLGTNDDSYVQNDETKRKQFEDAYVEFLGQIHRKRPNAKLVAAFGLMGDSLYETEANAVRRFTELSGFNEVYSYRIPVQDAGRNGYASCWHPSPASHKETAEGLAAFLKTIL